MFSSNVWLCHARIMLQPLSFRQTSSILALTFLSHLSSPRNPPKSSWVVRRLGNNNQYWAKEFYANVIQRGQLVPPQLTQGLISLWKSTGINTPPFRLVHGEGTGQPKGVSHGLQAAVFFQLQSLLLEIYTRMWTIMSHVECFVQEREVASLLKI